MPRKESADDHKDTREDIDALKADIAALREDLATLVKDLVAAGKVQAGEAGESLSDAARSRLHEYGVDLDRLSERGHMLMDSVQEHVERHPLTSIGIAVGVGLILGKIFRR